MPSYRSLDCDPDLMTARTQWLTQTSDGRDPLLLGLRLVATAEGWLSFPGGLVPAQLAWRLVELASAAAPGLQGAQTLVDEHRAVLEHSVGPVRVEGGPIFTLPGEVAAALEAPRIATSASGEREVSHLPRPLSWEEDEWDELLSGRSGPWAMALTNDSVVSICHTPRPMSPAVAECGVWTHPDHRGRRLAEATTAAWTRLVAHAGRTLFYSTDDCNLASQRVAAHLGLRLVGREWILDAGPFEEGDAWGNALLDHYRGVWVPTPELESDRGEVGQGMHPEWCFRDYDQWDWWDRQLLPLAERGPALDLGAGAGRAALWLQRRGVDVTAIDSSPGAVAVCRARGVRDARRDDLNDPPADQQWRSIFLLGGNLGLGRTWAGTRGLLSRLATLATPEALLVADTVDPEGPAEIGLRMRYKGVATPWWQQRNFSVNEVRSLIDGTGWTMERHLIDHPDHVVLLRRA